MTDTIMFEGIILRNVHHWEDCQTATEDGLNGPEMYSPRACVIHRPTPHHMRLWRLFWRDDRGIFERICPHGIGHPDPDQLDYWKERHQEWQAVHGCDSCCSPPVAREEDLWAYQMRAPRGSTATTARSEPSGGLEHAPSVVDRNRYPRRD